MIWKSSCMVSPVEVRQCESRKDSIVRGWIFEMGISCHKFLKKDKNQYKKVIKHVERLNSVKNS